MPSMCWYTFTFARPFQWGRLSLRRTDSDSLKFKLRGGLCAAELAVVRRLYPANTYIQQTTAKNDPTRQLSPVMPEVADCVVC